MTAHPSIKQIEDYADRRSSRAEWVCINEHLFACGDCYRHFLGIFQASRRFPIEIDLDELAGLKDWHLQGEELKAYVEGGMEELDLDYANSHLTGCGWCREEVIHYSEFTSKLEYYLSKRHTPIRQVPARGKYFPKFGALPFYWSPAKSAGIAALAILLIFTALLWSAYRTKPRMQEASLPVQSQEGGSETPHTSQATDTSRPVNETGNSHSQILPDHSLSNTNRHYSTSQELEESVLAENLVRPSIIGIFDKSSIVLRGDDNKSESFNVTSPYSTVIRNDRPTFRWTDLNGASSYVVSVYDSKLNLIRTSDPCHRNSLVDSESFGARRYIYLDGYRI